LHLLAIFFQVSSFTVAWERGVSILLSFQSDFKI